MVKVMVTEKHLGVVIKELALGLDIPFVQDLKVDKCPSFRKLPQRGFNRTRFQNPCATVNLYELDKLSGDKVDLNSLKEAGLIRSNSTSVKILGTGDVTKAFVVEVSNLSKSAKKKIEAAGGSIKE